MFRKPLLLLTVTINLFLLNSAPSFAQQPRRNNAINSKQPSKKDTTKTAPILVDTLTLPIGKNPAFRWDDRYLNRFSENNPQSPFYLKDPKTIKNDFSLNPDSKDISITERIGTRIEHRLPQKMTFNEYSSIQNAYARKSILREYENMQDGKSATSGKGLKPLLEKSPLVDRIFGGNAQDIRPNGSVDLILGYRSTFVDNPQQPLNLRRINIPIYDQRININFNGKLGEKMGLLGNLDTKAAFNFENQMRLNFKNQPEDILQSVEVGNVTLPNKSQLIPGVQNLFGAKLGFRLGKLDATVIGAQQRSKTERIVIRNGSQSRTFEVRCDNYEENKHFFLSQFFRDNYEKSLRLLPVVTSGVRVTRIEVYVTNRTNSFESMRNLIGFTDLAEANVSSRTGVYRTKNPAENIADNRESNTLYDEINKPTNARFRQVDQTNEILEGNLRMSRGIDYEMLRGAKRLTDREFKFHPELGYISLTTSLRNDEILAVAYEYTYKGKTYKVGELTEEYANRREDEVIALKLIKSSTIRNRTTHPMWNLMMKNIYNLGSGGLSKMGFQLRVIYKDDITGIDNPVLQEGVKTKDVQLVKIMNLDRLNINQDPQPDGNFDFVEDLTVDTRTGRLIFPVLEPFGKHLEKQFNTDPDKDRLVKKYVFNELYNTTMADAQQVTTKNKFFIRGTMQGGSGSDIPLPLGASGQSVRVMAGGTALQEGVDYQLDAQAGRLKIINQSILNSARDIIIEWERPDMFNTQIRFLYGTRLDYNLSKDIHLGATFMSLRESPMAGMYRTAIGQEPVNNTIVGLDINYRKDARWLTKALDALPLLQTKEMSSIQLTAEFAKLFPSVNTKRINNNAMIDDFEAARNINDLTRQPNRWRLGSTPTDFKPNVLPENKFEYNFKRAKLSVYAVDQSVYNGVGFGGGNVQIPDYLNSGNLYERGFNINDLFPGRSVGPIQQGLATTILDFAYFPSERGMYNFNPDLNPNGTLKNPKENFGSVMRGITADNDFENANTEYITFWLLDPFKDRVNDGFENKINTTGGKFKIQLGDISEDVIPDNRNNFENGFTLNSSSNPIETFWGRAPSVQFMTDAFDNNQAGSRELQDVGLDGLNNEKEKTFPNVKQRFLDKIQSVVTPAVYNEILEDPANDDYKFFLDPSFDKDQKPLLQRFKNYLGMEKNSPLTSTSNANKNQQPNQQGNVSQEYTLSNTVIPDKEDVNNDNTVNDLENYYEYEIPLFPNQLNVGDGFIVDKVAVPNGNGAAWYQFRIPIKKYTKVVGDTTIKGFKSIRFMRVVMSEFVQPVVLRMGAFQLESNLYRAVTKRFNPNTQDFEEILEPDLKNLKQGVVNIDENGCDNNGNCNVKAGKTPYTLPSNFGFRRDQDITQQQLGVVFNEQSMTLAVDNLKDGDARAVFRNIRLDLINYKNIRLLLHTQNENDEDGIAGAFLRIGTDLTENYYEIEIPKLKTTKNGAILPEDIWMKENQIFMPLAELLNLKSERNVNLDKLNRSKRFTKKVKIDAFDFETKSYTSTIEYNISVVGNPDLSTILNVMVGVKNPKDDGNNKSFTVWFNELSAFGFDQTSGDAGLLAANIKLADVATVVVNGNLKTFGFGGVQDKISERAREVTQGIGVSSNIEVDKFTPEKWGLKIPLFVNFDKQIIKPEFNPLDPDMRLEQALRNISDAGERELFRSLVVDESVKRGYNFSNVRKIRTKEGGKTHFYDIENFSFSYAQNNIRRSNILIESFETKQYRGGFTYQYQPKAINWEPFKNNKKMDRPFLYWLKDFNLSPLPSVIALRNDFDRSFSKTQLRNSELTTEGVDPFFEKFFMTNRSTSLQWNLTKSLLLTYDNLMSSIIDEPFGELDSKEKKDSVYRSFLNFGRAKNYNQDIKTTYRVPLDKFFLLDWITADAKYNVNFNYLASSFNLRDGLDANGEYVDNTTGELIGNTIKNGRDYGLTGRVDFVKLYNKSKYLRFANSPAIQRKRFTRNPADDEDIDIPPPNIAKNFTRILMAVRGIRYNYQIQETTVLPGFMPETGIFGLDKNNRWAPGGDFVLGSQSRTVFDRMIQNKWLSYTSQQTAPLIQTRQKKFDYNTEIEPFKDFRIQISGKMSRGDTYQEYLLYDKKTDKYIRNSPVRNGNFSMSFWAMRTTFRRIKENQTLSVNGRDTSYTYYYKNFEDLKLYREQILKDLRDKEGVSRYDTNSQDVLLPAFFYAYSGKKFDLSDAKQRAKVFNPFRGLPLPNWRFDFGGLANLKPFKKYFTSITISHAYTSTYNVGNFTSASVYSANQIDLSNRRYQLLTQTDPNSNFPNLYVSQYIMSTVSLEERFSPLIGVQFVTKGKITGRVDWNKERRAAMNFSNAQINETNSSDIVASIGFRKNNVKLPFKGRDGKTITLKNDLNFNLGLTIRDLKNLQRRLDGDAMPVNGAYQFLLRPEIRYQFNKKLSGSVYFEHAVTDPFVTSGNGFYTSRTEGAVNLRFSLSD